MRELKQGDKIFLARFNGYGRSYSKATVVKVTPTGLVDAVADYTDAQPTRFNKDGRAQGRDTFRPWFIDDEMTFEERVAYLAKEERTKHARNMVRNVTGQHDNSMASKEKLNEQLDELQAKLNEARKAVEEI